MDLESAGALRKSVEDGLAQTNKRRKTTTEPAWQRGDTMCTELLGDLHVYARGVILVPM